MSLKVSHQSGEKQTFGGKGGNKSQPSTVRLCLPAVKPVTLHFHSQSPFHCGDPTGWLMRGTDLVPPKPLNGRRELRPMLETQSAQDMRHAFFPCQNITSKLLQSE